jgi:hypothetical protein
MLLGVPIESMNVVKAILSLGEITKGFVSAVEKVLIRRPHEYNASESQEPLNTEQ